MVEYGYSKTLADIHAKKTGQFQNSTLDICQRLCGRKIWVCPGGISLPVPKPLIQSTLYTGGKLWVAQPSTQDFSACVMSDADATLNCQLLLNFTPILQRGYNKFWFKCAKLLTSTVKIMLPHESDLSFAERNCFHFALVMCCFLAVVKCFQTRFALLFAHFSCHLLICRYPI